MRSFYAPLGDGLALYDLVAVAVAVAVAVTVDVLVQVAVGMFEYELLDAVLRSLDRAERARGHRAGRPPEAPLWLGLIGRLTG
ncbi:hypothetical protein ACFWA5_40060 [Streptomyces mirabilis]|uniref:hypothetical protein n=1 Tax=Streptomyces mirabilis TaxID=68239 RepID=UPI00364CFA84